MLDERVGARAALDGGGARCCATRRCRRGWCARSRTRSTRCCATRSCRRAAASTRSRASTGTGRWAASPAPTTSASSSHPYIETFFTELNLTELDEFRRLHDARGAIPHGNGNCDLGLGTTDVPVRLADVHQGLPAGEGVDRPHHVAGAAGRASSGARPAAADVLERFWPDLVRGMEYLASIAPHGVPEGGTTYDVWDFPGVFAYTATLYVASLAMMADMAERDRAGARRRLPRARRDRVGAPRRAVGRARLLPHDRARTTRSSPRRSPATGSRAPPACRRSCRTSARSRTSGTSSACWSTPPSRPRRAATARCRAPRRRFDGERGREPHGPRPARRRDHDLRLAGDLVPGGAADPGRAGRGRAAHHAR